MHRFFGVVLALVMATAAAADDMSIRVQSDYPYVVQFEMFVQGTGQTIPPGPQVFELRTYDVTRYDFSCTRGTTLCIGVWDTGFPRSEWGAGFDGNFLCQFCCFQCQSGELGLTLRITEFVQHR